MSTPQKAMKPKTQGSRAAARSWASGRPSSRRGGIGPLTSFGTATPAYLHGPSGPFPS